jgi:hypothetical protein
MTTDPIYYFMFESTRNYLDKTLDIKPERIFEKEYINT